MYGIAQQMMQTGTGGGNNGGTPSPTTRGMRGICQNEYVQLITSP